MGKRSNSALRNASHIQPMADGTDRRACRRYGTSVPRTTWASPVETRHIEPRQRLSRSEIRDRELYGSVTRIGFEPKRAYR